MRTLRQIRRPSSKQTDPEKSAGARQARTTLQELVLQVPLCIPAACHPNLRIPPQTRTGASINRIQLSIFIPVTFTALEVGYNEYSEWEEKGCKYKRTPTLSHHSIVSGSCTTYCSRNSSAQRTLFPLSERWGPASFQILAGTRAFCPLFFHSHT